MSKAYLSIKLCRDAIIKERKWPLLPKTLPTVKAFDAK